jgi:hypothetical protein
MAEAMLDTPDLRSKLTQFVEANRIEMLKDQPDVPQLESERDEVKQQISTIVRCLTGTALADAQEELQRLGARRNAIEAKLQALKGQQTRDTRTVDVVVEEAMKVLEHDRKRLLSLPIEPLRNLVDAMLIDAAVDMETKNVELTISLPVWATAAPKKEKQPKKRAAIEPKTTIEAEETLCPAQSTWCRSGYPYGELRIGVSKNEIAIVALIDRERHLIGENTAQASQVTIQLSEFDNLGFVIKPCNHTDHLI